MGGTIGRGACSQLARVELGRRGGVKTKEKGGKGGTETEEREKEGKKQGQYTQRNVVLQTVKLAKLKCTVTMGTLGEKEEKIRLTMNTEKGRDNMYF